MHIIEQSCTLLANTPDPEILLERAGRTCYRSEDKITDTSAAKFVEMICKRQHESVLEHASATMLFTTDRGVTHELVRHRICSYSQESTRYVNYHKKGEIRVVKPLSFPTLEAESCWQHACEAAEAYYNQLISCGCSPEVARDVLPTCTAADIVITTNFREWLHIIRLRTSPAAHPKIRALISMAHEQLRRIAPTVFKIEEAKP